MEYIKEIVVLEKLQEHLNNECATQAQDANSFTNKQLRQYQAKVDAIESLETTIRALARI